MKIPIVEVGRSVTFVLSAASVEIHQVYNSKSSPSDLTYVVKRMDGTVQKETEFKFTDMLAVKELEVKKLPFSYNNVEGFVCNGQELSEEEILGFVETFEDVFSVE